MNLDPHLKDEVKKFLLRKLREESEVVTVVSAHPLTDGQAQEIKTLIPYSGGQMNTEVDKSLIAGIIVRKGSRILDLSVKGRLQSIENTIKRI